MKQPCLAEPRPGVGRQATEYAQAGIDGVVAKRVDAGKLIAAINAAMERSGV
ncbi:MAG: hypothetical protein J7515_19825 [Caulobacter sp.]|nr:hypothetical protein [Caulobacter sp.]